MAASKAFFATNAGKFAEQQELIATPAHYLEPMLQVISGLELNGNASVLELGPGTGWLLPQLARFARNVTAVNCHPDRGKPDGNARSRAGGIQERTLT